MSSRLLIMVGFVLTGLFLIFCFRLGMQDYCHTITGQQEKCISNFQKFIESPPNEKGDTLAGLAGSLAFLWIIITVLLQGNELSLQRQELERMRTAQQEQTEFLRAEEHRQKKAAQDLKIQSMVRTLQNSLPKLRFPEVLLQKTAQGTSNTKRVTFINSKHSIPSGELATIDWTNKIEALEKTLLMFIENEDYKVIEPHISVPWFAVLSQVVEINKQTQTASDATLEWVYYQLKLPAFEKVLKRTMENKILWASVGQNESSS